MENLIFGIVTGSILMLGTVGFTMIRRIENFLNIAHGQMLALGAYYGLFFNVYLGWNMIWATIGAAVLSGITGVILGKFFFHPIRPHGDTMLLFTSIGVAFIIHGIIEVVWGVRMKTYTMSPPSVWPSNSPLISSYELIIIFVAILSIIGLHLILTRTRAGKAIRAMASDFDLARVRGINTDKISLYVWFIASTMAGLAGVFTGLLGTVYSDMGWAQILVILSAAILGGLGSIYGVMVGSLLIGLGMDLSVLILPSSYRPAIAFAVILIVLFIKPEGIFGGRKARV